MTHGVLGSVGTVNVQGQISVQSQWRLLCSFSFYYFSQHAECLKNWLFPSLAGVYSTRDARLDQSRASEKYLIDYKT